MTPVLMRDSEDCEIAAIATASGRSYEEVQDAFVVGDLPFGLTNPIRGNPEMSYLALSRLGLWKRNIAWADLYEHRAAQGSTIILIHNPAAPILQQHWVVLQGYSPSGVWLYWGDKEQPRHVQWDAFKTLFLGGWPNCAYQILPLTWWQRFKRWLGLE